jgi:microcystin degradation protein MlrC
MRIGIGGIAHETNSFSNVATSEALFRRLTYNEGEALFTPGVRTFIGGFTDEGIAQGVDMAPALYANANPSGRIPDETLETLRDRLVEGLWQQHLKSPLDGIVFAPHGAGAADSYPDIEGEILRCLRERFGWEIPIGVSLDLHANVTEEMMRYADVLIGVKCYPHVDTYETSRKVLAQVLDIIRSGGRKPYKRFVHLPWLLAPAYGVTLQGPAHDVQQLTYQLEEAPGIHSVTFFHGFPYADIPQAGVTVTAFADTQEAADQAAMEVATYAWNRRNDFPVAAISPAQALDMAQQVEGIVVINESSDNPGGGAPGDGTHLLRELLKRNLPGSAFGHICDPEVAQLAAQAGVGAKISCLLGAKTDKLHGEPIEIQEAYVKAICDGFYINQSPMGKGSRGKLGLTIRLQVGNVDIVVSSRARQTMDKGPFEIVGINYSEYKILCLKSSQHFRGWWQERAAKIIPCDPPGIHCADLSVFDFKMANTNYFPLGDAQWNG